MFSNYFIEIVSSLAIILLLLHSMWLQRGRGIWKIKDKEELLKKRVRGERSIWILLCLLIWIILSVFIQLWSTYSSLASDLFIELLLGTFGLSLIIVGMIMFMVRWKNDFLDYRKPQGRKYIIIGVAVLCISLIVNIALFLFN